MALTPEIQTLIETEESVLKSILESIDEQIRRGQGRLQIESHRARELTSSIVATRRAEEKAMLASEEAVSHGLRDQKHDELKILAQSRERPYFARLIVEENSPSGPREIEYRIGFAANSDCRIIDWRKAPISKLYYEYKEGDEYSEEILGRERQGKIKLRHAVEIEKGELKAFACSRGRFIFRDGQWQEQTSGPSSARSSLDGHLPNIAALITPTQFKTITEDAKTAILIQGIAGSGKTTVALHRLAWLLHHENSELRAEHCLVLTHSGVLKRFISKLLPSLGVNGVTLLTYNEWAARTVGRDLSNCLEPSTESPLPQLRLNFETPHSIQRLFKSMALLQVIETAGKAGAQNQSIDQILLNVLRFPRAILEQDETKLLDQGTISQASLHFASQLSEGRLDESALGLLLRLSQIKSGGNILASGEVGKYGHLVADEIQEFSPAELATIIEAVKDTSQLTLVGDTAQATSKTGGFPGWDKLRSHWALKDEVSRYVTLSVSHRSTLPIMKLADYVQNRESVSGGRPGRVPIWFRAEKEKLGIESCLNWLKTATERYPTLLTAVLCNDKSEASYAQSLLEPTFGSMVRLGDDFNFSFDAGIVVTEVRQAKGLEFTNVLLWNPSARSYPGNTHSQNLLYVAITRAEENLCLVTWEKPSPYLPAPGSLLVRLHRIGQE